MRSFPTELAGATAPESGKFRAKQRLLGVVFAAVVGAACSSEPLPDAGSLDDSTAFAAEQGAAPSDPLAPGASVVCGVHKGPDGWEPELYVVYAMNQKLRHYPEFASAIGMDLVSDCEGAREFKRRYIDYHLANPGFDEDQPLGEMPEDDPELMVPPPSEEIQKIYNGQLAATPPSNPVVNLLVQAPPQSHPSWGVGPDANGKMAVAQCSGTFINKNWILTAGHCVTIAAIYKCLRAGTSVSQCKPGWEGAYAPFIVAWGPDHTYPDGTVLPSNLINPWLRAYVHPTWEGRSRWTIPGCAQQGPNCYKAESGANHDLALLHINYGWDGQFTPDVEDNGAKRLSIVTPPDLANWPLRFEGWGLPTGPAPTNSWVHRFGAPSNAQLQRMTVSLSGDHVVEGTAHTVHAPLVCEGDSGGPLLRTGLQLITNAGVQSNLEAIVGVASVRTHITGVKECKVTAGDTALWTRVDTRENKQFIVNTIKRWAPYTTMECRPRAVFPKAAPDEVQECWGRFCGKDSECSQGEYCFVPSFGSACSVCADGTCSCIKGQCAKRVK